MVRMTPQKKEKFETYLEETGEYPSHPTLSTDANSTLSSNARSCWWAPSADGATAR